MRMLKFAAVVVIGAATLPAWAKTVVCVEGSGGAALHVKEGYERTLLMNGDMVSIGGNLSDCLAMLMNGDTLVIVAHGGNNGGAGGPGSSFTWGGTRYTGFGNGAGQGTNPHPVPNGFNALRNITVRLCMCYSMNDPDNAAGGDRPMTEKIVSALGGGGGTGNTAMGFTGTSGAEPKIILPADTTAAVRMAVENCLRMNTAWANNPPSNRAGANPNQLTAAQAQVNGCPGTNGVQILRIDYCPPTANPDFHFVIGCECLDTDQCGFAYVEVNLNTAIPTMSEWGMILTGASLVLVAGVLLRHRVAAA